MQNCTAVDEALHKTVGLESTGFVEQLLPQLVNLVRASRQLPVGEEHAIRRGSREFLQASKELGDKSLGVAHKALRFLDQGSHFQTKSEDLSNFNVMIDSIDNILERVDICLQDHLSGQSSHAADDQDRGAAGSPPRSSTLPGAPGGGPKPQVRWRQLIDNERTSFVPRLLVKHNEQVPLAHEIVQAQRRAGLRQDIAEGVEAIDVDDEVGEPRAALPHPYSAELDALSWPDSCFQPVQPQRFVRMEDTPMVLVSTEKQLREMVQEIKATCIGKEIAVDVEHHDFRTYRGFVCLVQISTRHKDFVVDPFDIFEQMHMLNEVFTDPRIVKVLHGADRDVTWLQRDFSVYFVNMFDTGIATRVLRLQGGFSLANLVSHFCGIKLDKKYQTADWRQRPLGDELVQYARCDTHFLLYCYDRLRNALLTHSGAGSCIAAAEADELQVTDQGLRSMQVVLERSTELCRSLYLEEPFSAADTAGRLCERFGSKHRPLEPRNLGALKALLKWRDQLARSLDESGNFISPDAILWRIALAMPFNASRLRSACNPLPAALQQRAQEVVDLISRSPEETAAAAAAATAPAQEAKVSARALAGVAAAARGRQTGGSLAAPAAGAAAAVKASSLVPVDQEWPTRKCGAPQPVVHVAAAADGASCRRMEGCGALGAVLSTLAFEESSAEEGEEQEEGDVLVTLEHTPATSAERLRSIQESLSFVAAPPPRPPTPPPAPEAEGTGGGEAEGGGQQGLKQEGKETLEDVEPKVKRKKRKRNVGGSCLENVVKAAAAAAVSDPYAEAESDPYALETQAPASRPRKKKKVKRAQEQTAVDPYL